MLISNSTEVALRRLAKLAANQDEWSEDDEDEFLGLQSAVRHEIDAIVGLLIDARQLMVSVDVDGILDDREARDCGSLAIEPIEAFSNGCTWTDGVWAGGALRDKSNRSETPDAQ